MEANSNEAMRKALENIRWWFMATARVMEDDPQVRPAPKALYKLANDCSAALAAPARNCDVGTAEEQAERCRIYCGQQICKDCPCNTIGRCTLIWAQMPYEAANESEARDAQ